MRGRGWWVLVGCVVALAVGCGRPGPEAAGAGTEARSGPAAAAGAGGEAAPVVEKPLAVGVVSVQPMGSNDLVVQAERLGFYRKHGLRAEVTSTSSTTVVQGLISGSF